jgi:hypothetical protein
MDGWPHLREGALALRESYAHYELGDAQVGTPKEPALARKSPPTHAQPARSRGVLRGASPALATAGAPGGFDSGADEE